MSAFVGSVTIYHLQPQTAQVQVASSRGLPKLILTGRSTSSLRSTRDRLLSILKTHKIKLRSLRTTISLTPALPISTESHLDLALLVSLLADYHLYQPNSEDCFLGEVGLDGRLSGAHDLFYLVWAAASLGYKKVFLPQKSCQKLSFIKNIELVGIDHLQQLLGGRIGQNISHLKASNQLANSPQFRYIPPDIDINLIGGNQLAIRALMIAACGRHSLFLIGPPGYGKTMLARALLSLLPPLTESVAMQVAYWRQLAHLCTDFSLTPPLREVSFAITPSQLLGSSQRNQVGELRLTQHGILFVDELGGVSRGVIELLSKLMEPSWLARNSLSLAQLQSILVMASNPCPCGQGLSERSCRCSPSRKHSYLSKFTGAFLDRVDLFCEIDESVVCQTKDNLSSEKIRHKIMSARNHLYSVLSQFVINRQESEFAQYQFLISHLTSDAKKALHKAHLNLALSNRGLFKTLKISRTIASLEQATAISKDHIVEAIGYRRCGWIQSQIK